MYPSPLTAKQELLLQPKRLWRKGGGLPKQVYMRLLRVPGQMPLCTLRPIVTGSHPAFSVHRYSGQLQKLGLVSLQSLLQPSPARS